MWERERNRERETLSDMLEILWGTSCYGNREGSRLLWVVLPWQPPLGGQVMLRGRSWRRGPLKKKKCVFTGWMGGSEADEGDSERAEDDVKCESATPAARRAVSSSVSAAKLQVFVFALYGRPAGPSGPPSVSCFSRRSLTQHLINMNSRPEMLCRARWGTWEEVVPTICLCSLLGWNCPCWALLSAVVYTLTSHWELKSSLLTLRWHHMALN